MYHKNNLVNCPGNFYPNLLLGKWFAIKVLVKLFLISFVIPSQDTMALKRPSLPFFTLTGALTTPFIPLLGMTYYNIRTPNWSPLSVRKFTKCLASQREAHLGSVGRAIHLDFHSPAHIWFCPWRSRACFLAFLPGSFHEQPQSSGSSQRLAKNPYYEQFKAWNENWCFQLL